MCLPNNKGHKERCAFVLSIIAASGSDDEIFTDAEESFRTHHVSIKMQYMKCLPRKAKLSARALLLYVGIVRIQEKLEYFNCA